MKEKTRTEYSFLNASMSIACTVIGAVLGIGTTMANMLYRPLAENNISLLRTLIKHYRRLFNIVGALVFGIGLCLMPALPHLLKDAENVEHLNWIYLIYLTTNVLSYPLLYKRTLLAADQKEYMLAKYLIGAQFGQYITQIVVMLTVKSFMLYVLAGCLPTLLSNILSARKINRIYPFLNEHEENQLSEDMRRDVRRNIFATTMQKIGTTLINNTDSLILSSIFSVASVAQYSNYTLFCNGVDQILSSSFKGIINSVGNLGASRSSSEQMRRIFDTTLFINQWLYGFSAICLYELLSPFVALCFGEQYVFPNGVVLILCVNVFARGMRITAQTFHDSLGLYWYDRYRTLVEAAINLILSIWLAQRIGMAGVFVGTLVSGLMTTFWVEPYVLYRQGFHASVKSYFLQYGGYALVLAVVWRITDICCGAVRGGVLVQFAARLALCVFVPNLLFFLCYRKTYAYRGALNVCRDFYAICKKKWKK